MKRLRLVLLIAFAALLSARLTVPSSVTAAPPRDPGPAVGSKAPNIEGTTPNGDPISLNDFKGKLVMVDFFGDW